MFAWLKSVESFDHNAFFYVDQDRTNMILDSGFNS